MKAGKLFLVVLLSCGLLVEFIILYYFLVFVPSKLLSRPPQRYLLQVSEEEIPRFVYWQDDYQELKEAFQKEEGFLLQRIANGEKLSFGETKLAASLVKESAELLLQTLQEARSEEELNRLIRKRFIIYQAAGERVTLVGFGTFRVRERKARSGRNPQTGATIQIPAKKVPKFVPGKSLRDKVK